MTQINMSFSYTRLLYKPIYVKVIISDLLLRLFYQTYSKCNSTVHTLHTVPLLNLPSIACFQSVPVLAVAERQDISGANPFLSPAAAVGYCFAAWMCTALVINFTS
jgi:hypothetical protein